MVEKERKRRSLRTAGDVFNRASWLKRLHTLSFLHSFFAVCVNHLLLICYRASLFQYGPKKKKSSPKSAFIRTLWEPRNTCSLCKTNACQTRVSTKQIQQFYLLVSREFVKLFLLLWHPSHLHYVEVLQRHKFQRVKQHHKLCVLRTSWNNWLENGRK